MVDMPVVFLTLDDVLKLGPYRARSSLYQAVKAKRFPPPLKIQGRALWRVDEVAAANARLAAEAEAQRAA